MELDDQEEIRRRIQIALKESFRPEFLNRIDATIIFNRLTKEVIRSLVDIQLKRVIQERLLEPLSEKIIAGEIGQGDKVQVNRDGEHLVLSRSNETRVA